MEINRDNMESLATVFDGMVALFMAATAAAALVIAATPVVTFRP